MQRTIVIEYKGQKVVSQPFRFKHACIIDDMKHRQAEKEIRVAHYKEFAFEALKKMFEGTILTDEILDDEISIDVLKESCTKVLDWYLGIGEEVKNSSSPQPKNQEAGA